MITISLTKKQVRDVLYALNGPSVVHQGLAEVYLKIKAASENETESERERAVRIAMDVRDANILAMADQKSAKQRELFEARAYTAMQIAKRIISAADVRQREWRPMETAPRDGTPILACDAGPHAYVVEWLPKSKVWVGADGRCWDPIRWMPLPKPYEDLAKGETT